MKALAKVVLTVAVAAFASLASSAQASPVPEAAARCLARLNSISRVADRPGERVAGPAGCCGGQMRCSQFLATTTAVRLPSYRRS